MQTPLIAMKTCQRHVAAKGVSGRKTGVGDCGSGLDAGSRNTICRQQWARNWRVSCNGRPSNSLHTRKKRQPECRLFTRGGGAEIVSQEKRKECAVVGGGGEEVLTPDNGYGQERVEQSRATTMGVDGKNA